MSVVLGKYPVPLTVCQLSHSLVPRHCTPQHISVSVNIREFTDHIIACQRAGVNGVIVIMGIFLPFWPLSRAVFTGSVAWAVTYEHGPRSQAVLKTLSYNVFTSTVRKYQCYIFVHGCLFMPNTARVHCPSSWDCVYQAKTSGPQG